MSLLVVSRRPVMLSGILGLLGGVAARAQVTPAQTQKFEAWVEFTNRSDETGPMTNGTMLGFASEQVRRKQVGVTREGYTRLFAVVIPAEADGIILAAGSVETRTFGTIGPARICAASAAPEASIASPPSGTARNANAIFRCRSSIG